MHIDAHRALVLKQKASMVPMLTAKLRNSRAGDASIKDFTAGLPMITAPMTVVKASWAVKRPT